jgi:putative ATP-dependent endonuclease of the OLD family
MVFMSILIDKIRIKNFRSLRNIEVDLRPVTLLVGANNAGKTTFLRALNTVLGANKKLLNRDDLFIDKDGKQPEKSILIDIRIIPVDENNKRTDEFSNPWVGIFNTDVKLEGNQSFFAFRTEILFANDGDKYETNQYFLTNWNHPNPQQNDRLTTNIQKKIMLYFIDAQRDLQEDVKLRTSFFGKLASLIAHDYDEISLAEINDLVKMLNKTAIDKSKVLSHLQNKLSELNRTTQTKGNGVSISPFPLKIRDLHKGMKVHFQDGLSDTFSLEYHGMGTRSWASILSFGAFTAWETAQKEAEGEAYYPILALEEPEAHLHPNAQRTLYSQLKNISGQKIISTHSPYIAGQADLEELRHFYKAEDEASVTFLDLSTFTLDEKSKIKREVLQLQGELLFSKAVLLFEGETERQALPIFAQAYWQKYHFECGISFIPVRGFGYAPFILVANAMKIPWFILSDYDTDEVKKGVNKQLKSVGYTDAATIDYKNVLKLGLSIESYLIQAGYQNELKAGINRYKAETNTNQDAKLDFPQEHILSYDDMRLEKELRGNKTRCPTYWATEITQILDPEKRIPVKIRQLFDAISAELGILKI